MAYKKPTRPTLADARTSRVADLVDGLVDCHPGRAAARIARMDRDQLELVALYITRSVDPRFRFSKPLPLSPDDETDRARRKIAAWLAENPESIIPTTLAVGDAIKAHDPRPRADIADTPYTRPDEAA